MPQKLTPHFTLEEFVLSQEAARKGIDNMPPSTVRENLKRLALVLETVRSALGEHAIVISSGYRCPTLNKAIGGAKNSAHMQGLAVDFTCPAFGTVLQTAKKVASCGIVFDQIIYEYGAWVHLGLAPESVTPRSQKLSAFKGNGVVQGFLASPP